VVVQTGRATKKADGHDLIELLAGVEAGDRLVSP
jgi:hypothetical protein